MYLHTGLCFCQMHFADGLLLGGLVYWVCEVGGLLSLPSQGAAKFLPQYYKAIFEKFSFDILKSRTLNKVINFCCFSLWQCALQLASHKFQFFHGRYTLWNQFTKRIKRVFRGPLPLLP